MIAKLPAVQVENAKINAKALGNAINPHVLYLEVLAVY
jgi:hypothetical protein